MIEVLASIVYGIVENSWYFSTVFVKYLLAIGILYSLKSGDRLESFRQFVDNYSRESILVIVLMGTASLSAGYSFSPVLPVFSGLVAVSYFGYLFWRF